MLQKWNECLETAFLLSEMCYVSYSFIDMHLRIGTAAFSCYRRRDRHQ